MSYKERVISGLVLVIKCYGVKWAHGQAGCQGCVEGATPAGAKA